MGTLVLQGERNIEVNQVGHWQDRLSQPLKAFLAGRALLGGVRGKVGVGLAVSLLDQFVRPLNSWCRSEEIYRLYCALILEGWSGNSELGCNTILIVLCQNPTSTKLHFILK